MKDLRCEICGKRFGSPMALGTHRKLSNSCSGKIAGRRDTRHAERRASEFAAQLVAEGEDPRIASARARAAYGLQDRAPAGNPQPTAEMRRAWLDEAATSRHSERLPSVEGRTSGAVGARR